jgi:hypothetical protein
LSSSEIRRGNVIGREIVLRTPAFRGAPYKVTEIRHVFVRGNMAYRVAATYREGESDAAARAFLNSFELR